MSERFWAQTAQYSLYFWLPAGQFWQLNVVFLLRKLTSICIPSALHPVTKKWGAKTFSASEESSRPHFQNHGTAPGRRTITLVVDENWRFSVEFVLKEQIIVTFYSINALQIVISWRLFTSDKGGGKCVCPRSFVCLSVCLSVSKITQKRVHGFGWNIARRQMSDMDELINFWAGSGL